MSFVPPVEPPFEQPPLPQGQPQGQPQGAPQYGYSQPYYTGWGQPPLPPVARPRTLGVVAMLIAIPLIVLSALASVIVGLSAGPLASHTSSGVNFTTDSLTEAQAAAFVPVGILMGAQMIFGTILGILALVLGIIAVATKRGRSFGVVAIVLAGVAPILSFALYIGMLAASVPPL